MTENDDSKVEHNGPHPSDPDAGLGWDFVKEVWSSRRFVASSIIAGLILGGTGGYLIPRTYSSKIQVKAALVENYDSLFSAFLAKDEMNQADSKSNQPEFKILNSVIVDNVIVDIVNSPENFSVLASINSAEGATTNHDYGKIYQVKATTPVRGLEKFFVPGYEINLSLENRNELVQLTENFVEELTIVVNDSSFKVFKGILETNSKLIDFNLEVARKKYEKV